MSATHAQIAKMIVGKMPPGVFAHAAHGFIFYDSASELEAMLPGMRFAHRKVNKSEWELTGVARDGSVVVWTVGA